MLPAGREIGERVGITVESYYFSEPQSAKDICDRILCPLKSSIRPYCSEGHDILTASDIKHALQHHPVRGTFASVNVVDESKKNLQINKLEHFSFFHNFRFEYSGIRAWKAYGIGQERLFPYDTVYVQHQGPTMLQTEDGFSNTISERALKPRKKPSAKTNELTSDVNPLFQCSVPGCTEAFDSFQIWSCTLISANTITLKQLPSESVYDRVRRDYAAKFASVDLAQKISPVTLPSLSETLRQ